jgi:DEAD/DEAH box helicase/Helicase conserved C-terminal domain
MTIMPSGAVLAVLDVLEESDARNLAWGLTDESWTRDGLIAFLAEHLPEGDPGACIEELVAANLLIQLPREWPLRYRTRMAESVRLFSHLRQLFPGRPWQSGSRLVSDFRFLRRPREFPARKFKPEEVLRQLDGRSVSANLLPEAERVLGDRLLSRFQIEAAAEIFAALRSGIDRGVVVGAGTGSGKTLAFYLPALAQLAASGVASPRVIAIYPRNELLKDQLATAMHEVRSLRTAGGRRLVVGAYFGPTPNNATSDPERRGGWRKQGTGWICPFLTCPATDDGVLCGGALIWRQPQGGRGGRVNWGHLNCQRCGDQITPEEFRLTRAAMQDEPPDILFTTTEMLNQELSNGWSRQVFGVGPRARHAPNLVLLDEVHTYSGTSGAHVAYLLRRWRVLMGSPTTWVGLSATLANAAAFFADLCGLRPESVSDVRPDPDDMARQGGEYQLLLRGDPASQSALLSTTIQSLMLLRRVLDENGTDSILYGSRVFAFLENLDLVNRLYRQLLNAEGRDPLGRPDPAGHVLASLRVPKDEGGSGPPADEPDWDRDGQYWWLTEQLGFGTRALQVSRTSSQDTGVAQLTDVVVATSALEVGYDDPRVGAVLQHKAPRDIAQYLQRRGRAGRLQKQRPWTVAVFSDYGRDRLAFQSYETILDPSIPVKSLPLGNQSVRKMQAAMCLVDWIAMRLGADGPRRFPARWLLARRDGADARHVEDCLDLLEHVLNGDGAQQDLINFVRASLGLSKEEVESVCWEYPRSLLLEAVPTAYRRLRSGWATVQARELKQGTDTATRWPLPEYIPPNLFSDLALPEVEVAPPADYDPAAETSLAVAMALNELAPGKVTLRWAVQKVKGLWIEVPSSGVVDLDAGMAPNGEQLLKAPRSDGGTVQVIRPLTMRPDKPPADIRPTSNGWLQWEFHMDAEDEGTQIPRPRSSPLGQLIPSVTAFLNADRGPLPTWRYAFGGTAEIVTRAGHQRREYTFAWHGEPVGVGFANTVDAMVVTAIVPQSVNDFRLESDVGRLRQLRTDRFATIARQDLEDHGLGPFAAAWITDVVLSVAAAAVLRGDSITDLVGLESQRWQDLAREVVDGVLLALDHSDSDEAPLRDTVLQALRDPDVIGVLERALPILREAPSPQWLPWLRARFMQTLAAAWQAAAQQACLDFNVEADALVDVIDEGGPRARIVISDTVPGGGGLVESLTRRIADDPRRFDSLVAAAVEPSDSEEVDPSLRRVLDLLATSAKASAAAQQFRSAAAGRLTAWQSLISCLAEEGVPWAHANMSALAARLFRPGSTTESDELLRLALKRWDDLDTQAGFAIDHRAVCAFLAKDDEVLERLRSIAAPAAEDDLHMRGQLVLLSLLWTRACARRPETLRAASRFVSNPPPTERTLLRDVLPSRPPPVDVDLDGWREALAATLHGRGAAQLVSGTGQTDAVAGAVRELMVDPLEAGWLKVYPQLDSITREGGRYTVSMSLREAPQ